MAALSHLLAQLKVLKLLEPNGSDLLAHHGSSRRSNTATPAGR